LTFFPRMAATSPSRTRKLRTQMMSTKNFACQNSIPYSSTTPTHQTPRTSQPPNGINDTPATMATGGVNLGNLLLPIPRERIPTVSAA
jgi:hypothetical protein